ncbi:alpha-hydroxy-acid oxidizing enzyme [Virgisporangium aliadipatigenens]|uniref:Alpha-hydroxy-acid oxidizing enzyme n=1 Tax=Virgisporangium aliadipatigenens TaxID=741659 RepID=A0A8J3YT81_9ACTN|nr:alpha-hydroxy acid oxidase [Virgisporangium aliadipatigenens]GIJ49460.1 alpha-hydroxy-acid oxidizing enzyme [Virgisporangium aliadipatigenens]
MEAAARELLPPPVYDFFAGGADDENTLRDNVSAFDRLRLVPRVLCGAGRPDLPTPPVGAMPVVLAPTAFHRLAHEDGERATARAASAAGVVMVVSMAATVAVEEVLDAHRGVDPDAPAPWFQLYPQPDKAFMERLVKRVEAAGCGAFVLSVDSPVFGHRRRDVRNGFLDLPEGLHCENLRDPDTGAVRTIAFDPRSGWDCVRRLRETTPLPLWLKGIAHPDDARLAVRHGAAGIVVSNHGGRQLDGMPAAIDLLPSIVDAVGGRIPVLMDGGVRRGTDVVKALALGATAVGVGRPVLWGLATAGEAGVTRMLDLLRAEISRALALCGVARPSDLTRSVLCG